MDIKTSLDKYESVVRKKVETGQILKSIRLIMGSGLDYEFRTTVAKPLIEKEDFTKIGQLVKGCRLYVLQRFVSSKVLDDEHLDIQSYSDEEIACFRQIMEGFVQRCTVR
ncbi:MAG: hypothetical protein JRJ77_16840 [Deltaproteobacteria bacterium]|nr:hypothetical protein [Deltaproteobacteria bacterium]